MAQAGTQQRDELQKTERERQQREADPRAEIERAELVDYGVAQTARIRVGQYEGPTPAAIVGPQTITTFALHDLLLAHYPPVLIDVLDGDQTVGLANAVWLPGAGRGNSVGDTIQTRLAAHLAALTRGDKAWPIVVFCRSRSCWLSHNAAVRAVALGYSRVYWYRGGRNAWIAAGLPMKAVRLAPF